MTARLRRCLFAVPLVVAVAGCNHALEVPNEAADATPLLDMTVPANTRVARRRGIAGGDPKLIFSKTRPAQSIDCALCLLPIFGFLTLGMHAGFAIYFPELFPTHLTTAGS